MLLIPALRRQRQADLCEFKASLVYRVSSRAAKSRQRDPVSKNQKTTKRIIPVNLRQRGDTGQEERRK